MSSRPFLAKRGSSLFNATIEMIHTFHFECMHKSGYKFLIEKTLNSDQLNVAKTILRDADSVYVKNGWKGSNVSFSGDSGIHASIFALKANVKDGMKPCAYIHAERTERIRELAKEMRADKAVARSTKKAAKPKADLKTRRDVI